jgi:outer membrane protein assembly factor BamD (BamD/ComL family)
MDAQDQARLNEATIWWNRALESYRAEDWQHALEMFEIAEARYPEVDLPGELAETLAEVRRRAAG